MRAYYMVERRLHELREDADPFTIPIVPRWPAPNVFNSVESHEETPTPICWLCIVVVLLATFIVLLALVYINHH